MVVDRSSPSSLPLPDSLLAPPKWTQPNCAGASVITTPQPAMPNCAGASVIKTPQPTLPNCAGAPAIITPQPTMPNCAGAQVITTPQHVKNESSREEFNKAKFALNRVKKMKEMKKNHNRSNIHEKKKSKRR